MQYKAIQLLLFIALSCILTIQTVVLLEADLIGSMLPMYHVTLNRIDPMSSEGAKPEHLSGAISFKSVKFAYPSRPNLYIFGGAQAPQGLSLDIIAGETVAIVSATGMLLVKQLLLRLCSTFFYARDIR
jgi:ABC-type multidrug transport system fused ATPase/permease subunit